MRPCVCVPRTPHGGLSDTSALEISSGSGLNSLPVRIGVRTLGSPAILNKCFAVISLILKLKAAGNIQDIIKHNSIIQRIVK